MNPGWVYILTNPSLRPDYLKIGRTTINPLDRASNISSATGVAKPFEVAYKEYVPDCVRAETLVHRQLAHCRISGNREFFQLDLASAREAVRTVCEQIREETAAYKLEKVGAELKAKNDEICVLKAVVKNLVAEQERVTLRYQKLRRRVRTKANARIRRTMLAVLVYIGRMAQLTSTAFRTWYVKHIPDRSDRKFITWGLIVPVGVGGWIALLVFYREFALGAVLMLLVIGTGTIIAGNRQSSGADK